MTAQEAYVAYKHLAPLFESEELPDLDLTRRILRDLWSAVKEGSFQNERHD
jgi:hypothetical protein